MKIRLENARGEHVQNVEIEVIVGEAIPRAILSNIPGAHWHGVLFLLLPAQAVRPEDPDTVWVYRAAPSRVVTSANCRDSNWEDPR